MEKKELGLGMKSNIFDTVVITLLISGSCEGQMIKIEGNMYVGFISAKVAQGFDGHKMLFIWS